MDGVNESPDHFLWCSLACSHNTRLFCLSNVSVLSHLMRSTSDKEPSYNSCNTSLSSPSASATRSPLNWFLVITFCSLALNPIVILIYVNSQGYYWPIFSLFTSKSRVYLSNSFFIHRHLLLLRNHSEHPFHFMFGCFWIVSIRNEKYFCSWST